MQSTVCLGLIALGVTAGCTGATGIAEKPQLDFAVPSAADASESPLRAGEARVVDPHVNPMVPIHVESRGDSIAVTFGQRDGAGALAMLDPSTLEASSWQPARPEKSASVVPLAPQRVALEGGRTLVCRREGSIERGYWAVAQLEVHGVPRGTSVVISPPGADVVGVPHVVAAGPHRVVAVFAAMIGESYKLVTVPVDGI
jgi:hypothetical protein